MTLSHRQFLILRGARGASQCECHQRLVYLGSALDPVAFGRCAECHFHVCAPCDVVYVMRGIGLTQFRYSTACKPQRGRTG